MTPPNIGYPERWAAFNQRNVRFVSDCYPALVTTSEKILNRHVPIKSVADDVMFLLGRAAFEDYCELWVLAGNGYGFGAFKILRGLYEKVVTLGYLMKHQSEIQRFVDYEIVQRRRLMNRVKQDPHLRHRFPEAEYARIEAAYQSVKDQFLDTAGRSLSWTPLDTFSMAMKAGYDLDSISVSAYVLPNLKVHATVSDLAERKVSQGDGTYKFNNEPQEQHADSALVTGTHILIAALFVQEDYFELGMRSGIEQVQISFARSIMKAGDE
jgi:Family of unknown function (DUF5677)